MIKKKNLKAFIALATLTAMLSTGVVPVGAITSAKEDTKAVSAQKLRNVMYYGDWSIWDGEGKFYPQNIPAEDLTHLNFAFMDFAADGSFAFCDTTSAIGHPLGHKELPYDENANGGFSGGVLSEFQVLKQRNPNLKIGISIGGWSKSGDFSAMAASPTARANFVKNALEMVRNLNMDFVDLDWEYPGANQVRQPDKVDNKNDEGTPHATAADKENYILLLQDLRTALDKQGKELGRTYELSAALPMANSKVTDGIDVKRMFELLDFGNIMTYDAAGAWDTVSGHQSALYSNPKGPYVGAGFSVDESVTNYIKNGAKPEKIVIGAAYYTRGWEKVANNGPDKTLPGLYGTAEKVNRDADNTTQTPGANNFAKAEVGNGGRLGGVWPWRAQAELKRAYAGMKEYWDDTAKAPYLYNESTGAFFTYDNPRSIQEKVKYVKQKNLGGMIAWMASQDAATPGSGEVRNELTHATKVALYGDAKIPANPITDIETFGELTMNAVAEQWGSGSEITFKVVANSPLTSRDTAVARSERLYKTIKFPKLYVKTKDVVLTAGEGAGTVTKEGDYYVIDLGGSYEGKLIEAGDSKGYTFKIKANKKVAAVGDAITSVDVTQRMYLDAPEFARTNLYKGAASADEDVNEDGKIDVLDLSAVGAKYNLKKGQAGFNSPIERCDVNKDNIVDIYDITRVARKMGTTNPTPDPDPTPDPSNAWDANKAYNAGETVTYQGKTYRAKWYTKGETPGQPWNAWELVK